MIREIINRQGSPHVEPYEDVIDTPEFRRKYREVRYLEDKDSGLADKRHYAIRVLYSLQQDWYDYYGEAGSLKDNLMDLKRKRIKAKRGVLKKTSMTAKKTGKKMCNRIKIKTTTSSR